MAKPKLIFTKEQIESISTLYELGAIDEHVAKVMNLPLSTYKAAYKYNKLTNTVKNSKGIADLKVKKSLYMRACGYDYVEQHVTKDGDVVDVTKHIPPDTLACIFWLGNRDSENWKNVNKIEHTGNVDQKITYIIKDTK